MSSSIPLPPRKQLCNRYCSNKHTHTPLSATSGNWFGLGSEFTLTLLLARAPLLLATLLSHTSPFPRVPLRSLVCGHPSPQKPRLVLSHNTCPPLSSSPHAHSFVKGTTLILVRDGQTSPLRLWLVVFRSTVLHYPPPPTRAAL
jgi:hypothetical protein